MSRSKHSEAQMIAAVKQMEAGRKAEDVAREVGVSAHTIYAWKSKYGGMDVSNDSGLRERLVALAREKPRFGYRRLHVLLGREGEQVNHKRVHRIYREAGLALRRKKRKHCVRLSTPLGTYTAANPDHDQSAHFLVQLNASRGATARS